MRTTLFHLALAADWDPEASDYRGSTIGRTLAEEGFIHCSTAEQVQATADRYYRGRSDVVLLGIDPGRVDAEIRVEGGFPHLYGPLPTAAVTSATAVAVGPGGALLISDALGSPGRPGDGP